MSHPTLPKDCPCGSGKTYAACCGELHRRFADTGELTALSAEVLMRSRYSAFVLDQLDYLRATWHSSKRPEDLAANEAGLRWLGLEIKKHGQQDADHATVEFVARSKLGGRAWRLHETSRFVREDGVWYYVDGDLA
ncbi:YchJ family metal-binding protein [Pelomonas sp. SE-A7]|uniref:YchJ family protein n=1 Tax=Pelomonas sp. SE-A7 TaxID=3054953 RepID=UPI00259C9ADA|nr:YchJ family metal-binding protein [Pelomonas sp. SE-A7]MDM4767216.1 YchJ family metal-binding protein [Pelomonas sp. SE-A7]